MSTHPTWDHEAAISDTNSNSSSSSNNNNNNNNNNAGVHRENRPVCAVRRADPRDGLAHLVALACRCTIGAPAPLRRLHGGEGHAHLAGGAADVSSRRIFVILFLLVILVLTFILIAILALRFCRGCRGRAT